MTRIGKRISGGLTESVNRGMSQLDLTASLKITKSLGNGVQRHVGVIMPSRDGNKFLEHIRNDGGVGALDVRLRGSLPQAGHSDMDVCGGDLGVYRDDTRIRVGFGAVDDVLGGGVEPGIAERGETRDGDGKVDDADFGPSEGEGVGIEIEAGDNSEVVGASAEGLVEIFILILRGVDDGSTGEDDLHTFMSENPQEREVEVEVTSKPLTLSQLNPYLPAVYEIPPPNNKPATPTCDKRPPITILPFSAALL